MLALQRSKSHQGKCTPNVLPCRINHNGSVNASKRFWNPQTDADGSQTAYFRGRKLHGTTITLPEGYTGSVLTTTNREVDADGRAIDQTRDVSNGRNDGGGSPGVSETKDVDEVLEEKASFDEILVWGHEVSVDGTADAFARGVGEWVAFAEAIHEA